MILDGVHIQFPHKPLHLLEGGGAFGGFYEGVGLRVRGRVKVPDSGGVKMFSCHRERIINDTHSCPAHTFPSTGINISNKNRNFLDVNLDIDANLRPVVLSCLCIV